MEPHTSVTPLLVILSFSHSHADGAGGAAGGNVDIMLCIGRGNGPGVPLCTIWGLSCQHRFGVPSHLTKEPFEVFVQWTQRLGTFFVKDEQSRLVQRKKNESETSWMNANDNAFVERSRARLNTWRDSICRDSSVLSSCWNFVFS